MITINSDRLWSRMETLESLHRSGKTLDASRIRQPVCTGPGVARGKSSRLPALQLKWTRVGTSLAAPRELAAV